MSSELAAVVEAAPIPQTVISAVKWAAGLGDKETHVAERLARCMPDIEQEATVKLMEQQQPMAASALADERLRLPSRRRLDVVLRLKRAWGALFANWCAAQKI